MAGTYITSAQLTAGFPFFEIMVRFHILKIVSMFWN